MSCVIIRADSERDRTDLLSTPDTAAPRARPSREAASVCSHRRVRGRSMACAFRSNRFRRACRGTPGMGHGGGATVCRRGARGHPPARVAVAIERHRRNHDGLRPESLTDLSPDLLPDIPTDPLSGKPLLFSPEPNGYIVYSVGPNVPVTERRRSAPSFRPRGVPGCGSGTSILRDGRRRSRRFGHGRMPER